MIWQSAFLQTEEFNAKAKEIDLQIRIGLVSPQLEGTTEIICEHKDMRVPHYAHGLCRKCYDDVNTFPSMLIWL